MSISSPATSDFFSALAAPGPSPEIPDSDNAYGFLIGDWQLDVLHYWAKNVADRRLQGEVHAAWVLEGRAVQDIWIMPPRSHRSGQIDSQFNMYGTTLRVWDRALGAWRITWANPAGDHYEQQIGRTNGNDVVQIGSRDDGTTTRWSFTDITPTSFHWLGESQQPGAKSWILEGEFRATRLR